MCSSDNSYVTISLANLDSFNCTSANQGTTFSISGYSTAYSGTFTCPSSIVRFCGMNQHCPGFCNSAGYCYQSQCYC